MVKFDRKLYNKIKNLTNNFQKWKDYKENKPTLYYKNKDSIFIINVFIKARISNGEENLHQLIATFKDNFSL